MGLGVLGQTPAVTALALVVECTVPWRITLSPGRRRP
jgi:hypothetical protein